MNASTVTILDILQPYGEGPETQGTPGTDEEKAVCHQGGPAATDAAVTLKAEVDNHAGVAVIANLQLTHNSTHHCFICAYCWIVQGLQTHNSGNRK